MRTRFKRVGSDIKRIRAAFGPFEGRPDILSSPDFQGDDLEGERAGRSLNLADFQHGARIAALAKIANLRRPGTASRKSSRRLAAVSPNWFDKPVRLPPGRARLATRPVLTGSFTVAKTIGIIAVACFAAIAAGVVDATMRSTLS